MLPRLTKFIKKGPPEGMVSIDEVPITQLEAMVNVRGQFDDDVGELEDEEEEVAADHSAEKLQQETEANATQDSNYTPEGDPTPSTVGTNSIDATFDEEVEMLRRIRKPSAKALAAGAASIGATEPVKRMEATVGATEPAKRMLKQPIALQLVGEDAIHLDPRNLPDPTDYMKIFPRPDFNLFKVENLKICMKANKLTVGKGGRKDKMVAQCVQRWDELHPMKDVRKVDKALELLAKKAIDIGLTVAKGKSSLSQWNEAQDIARESIRTGRPLASFFPQDVSPSSTSTSSKVDRPPSKSTSSNMDRPSSKSTSSNMDRPSSKSTSTNMDGPPLASSSSQVLGAPSASTVSDADRRSSMDRESFRLLLERAMVHDKNSDAVEQSETPLIDLTDEVAGTPSIEQVVAQLEDDLHLPQAKRGRWSDSDRSTPADVVRQALSEVHDGGEVAPTVRVLSAEMSTHSAHSTQSTESDGADGGHFDTAMFCNQVKR